MKLTRTIIASLAVAPAVMAFAMLVGTSRAAAQDGAASEGPRRATAADVDLSKIDMDYADPAVANIAGFWRPDPKVELERFFLMDGTQLPQRDEDGQDGFPYRPEWQKVYQARRDAEMAGKSYGDPQAACWPAGLYKNYVGFPAPMEISQTPGRVLMMFQRMSPVRRIYTDGRGHPGPDDLMPSADGHSTGHWEGKTLVIDTIGLRREFTLSASPGMPHSSKLHVTERITRTDPVTLTIEIILDDPVAFTQPVKNTLVYKLWVNDGMVEDFCTDNNRDWPDRDLIVHLDTEPRKRYGFDLPEEPEE